MLSSSCSVEYLPEWTPIITSASPNSDSSFFRSGMMCWQLMQPSVQKSSSTTLPLSSASVSGFSTLNQVTPVGIAGAGFFPAHDFFAAGAPDPVVDWLKSLPPAGCLPPPAQAPPRTASRSRKNAPTTSVDGAGRDWFPCGERAGTRSSYVPAGKVRLRTAYGWRRTLGQDVANKEVDLRRGRSSSPLAPARLRALRPLCSSLRPSARHVGPALRILEIP